MSENHKRSDRPGARSNASGRGAVPLPGTPADFAEMLSSLPDADSSHSSSDQDSTPQVNGTAGIADMFSSLPDAVPASAAAQAAKDPSLPRRASRGAPAPSIRRKPVQTVAPPPTVRPAGANELPPGVEEVLFADPPPIRSTPSRQPVAIPFNTSKSSVSKEPAGETSGQTITQQILDLLEQNGLAAVSQLRIEVHNGVVVVAGEVPTPYEKQLVAHFCRQVPGVEKFVDSTVVREARPTPKMRSARPSRRSPRQPIEWRLPFRAWHVGAVAGAVLLVWGAFSLGFGRGGPERLAVYPVTGSLVFEGQPAAGATIVLYPQDPSLSARPRATVESDGSIVVTTYEFGDGAPAGEYKATFEWRRAVEGQESAEDSPPPANVLPAAYGSPGTTPVRLIVEEGENEFPAINFAN